MPSKYYQSAVVVATTATTITTNSSTAIVSMPSTSANSDNNSPSGDGVISKTVAAAAAAKSTKMENLVKNIRQRQNMRYITPPSIPPRVASATTMMTNSACGHMIGGLNNNNWSCLSANAVNNFEK